MSKKITEKNLQQTFPQNSANLWLIIATILSISLGCSYFKNKTETPVETKQITLADAKNSRDLVSVMKSHDKVKDYVLTKAFNEEKSLTGDGKIAQIATEYWSGLNTVNMEVMKFSSADKASKFLDDEESSQKAKSNTPARGKKTNGDLTLLFRDGNKTINFIACKKDFCYSFSQKIGSDVITDLLGMTDFFDAYDKKYLGGA